MAYKKLCDNCHATVGGGTPFIEIHGSIAEQIENPPQLMFRYLTDSSKSKLVFCNDFCEQQWKDKKRVQYKFVEKPRYG